MIEKKFNPKNLMKGAEPATEVNRVTSELIREKAYQLIDYDRLKRDSAYCGLAHQVVGAEVLD